jgi:hypothetical protein
MLECAVLCCAAQEDEPCKTAEYLQQFLHRFRIGEPPMVIPKARSGVRPVLPVVGGPLHVAPAAAGGAAAAPGVSAAGGAGKPAAVAAAAFCSPTDASQQQHGSFGLDNMQH